MFQNVSVYEIKFMRHAEKGDPLVGSSCEAMGEKHSPKEARLRAPCTKPSCPSESHSSRERWESRAQADGEELAGGVDTVRGAKWQSAPGIAVTGWHTPLGESAKPNVSWWKISSEDHTQRQ